ncbi:siderophore-iron reductase FhuF [Variovorax beijingensis]|uniref:Siderophore-iron reductase FhuF n=1 Tax=Variovorax beijingensis TaxID=2496117 RepID=A0A3P3F1I8_9BURK|nr:siderophore-iron reductase FhuF [Variovorax beijingensis]
MNTAAAKPSSRDAFPSPLAGRLVIALLEPLFPGALAVHAERLQCADAVPAGALRVADLAHSRPLLADVLHLHARARGAAGARDLRPVASAWSLDYLSALLPPVVAAASVLQHVFPVSAEHIWVRLDDKGTPSSFHVLHLGDARRGADAAQRYAPLLWQHLQPLFTALCSLTRLAPKILWGNTARHLEPIFDMALAATGGAAHIAHDRDRLLHHPAWPDEARPANPLHARCREVRPVDAGQGRPVKLHRQCCLYYLLPCEDYCGACPLAPQHRKSAGEILQP